MDLWRVLQTSGHHFDEEQDRIRIRINMMWICNTSLRISLFQKVDKRDVTTRTAVPTCDWDDQAQQEPKYGCGEHADVLQDDILKEKRKGL